MTDTATLDTGTLHITESAARRVALLSARDGRPGLMLRLTVSGGGCSGFQYRFSFDSAVAGDDRVFDRDGARVVTDECSLGLLGGATLDYVEDLMGAAFQVRNPNAASSCGCGNSFSV
jgi:iron-sulfur cluster insertion protein